MTKITPLTQRFRRHGILFGVAILLIQLCTRVSLVPVAAAAIVFPTDAAPLPRGSCVEIKEDFDLRNLARDDNVFLMVHEAGESNDASRRHLCDKLKATPEERLLAASPKNGRRTTVAYLEVKPAAYDADGFLQDGGGNFARASLGVKRYPEFLYIEGGMEGSSKYSNHVTNYPGPYTSVDSGDETEMSGVEKFLNDHSGFNVGNDVYNIVFFDSIASRFVAYGDASGLDRMKQRGLGLLVRFSTLFSFKEPFSSIGTLYNRAFAMSLEHGVDYCVGQVKNIEKKIEAGKGLGNGALTQQKLHQLQQKLAILRAFANPKELTVEEEWQIFFHSMLHVGLLVATLLLFVVPGEDEEEEAVNAVPVEAKVVGEVGGKKKRK